MGPPLCGDLPCGRPSGGPLSPGPGQSRLPGSSVGRPPGGMECGADDGKDGVGCGECAATGAGSTGDPPGDTGIRAGECSANCGTVDGKRWPTAAGMEERDEPAGTDTGSCGAAAGTETGSCAPPAGTDTGSRGPPAATDIGSCGPPPGTDAGSCRPPLVAPGGSGGAGPGAAFGPGEAPGAASGGRGVDSTGTSNGFGAGNATGLPLTGASIVGRSPLMPSRFLVRSPLVLATSGNPLRAPAAPTSPSAALPAARPAAPAASAASAPRAAAPAPSAAAPASPAPGMNSVPTSKMFSPNPNPGRAVLQSSRCSNPLSICRFAWPASWGLRKALIRLPFHILSPMLDQVAAAPLGSTRNHRGSRSPRTCAMPTAPLRTPSFAFTHVSNTVATGLPTRYFQDLWMGSFQATSVAVDSGSVGVMSMGRSSSFPL